MMPAGVTGQDAGDVRATVRISPLVIELKAPRDDVRVGQRFALIVRVDNLGSTPLTDVETRLLFDESGLDVLAHRSDRRDDLRADGHRTEIWSLRAREPGSYVLLASVEAMLGDEAIPAESNSIIVDVQPR